MEIIISILICFSRKWQAETNLKIIEIILYTTYPNLIYLCHRKNGYKAFCRVN